MANVKFSEFQKATQSKDTDELAILQDGVNKMIPSPVLESKIINKTVSRVIQQGGASLNLINPIGVVPTYADLASLTPNFNDAYQVESDGLVYVYTENGFQAEGNGFKVQAEPTGVVEEGNTQAVSGGEVYEGIYDIVLGRDTKDYQSHISIDLGKRLDRTNGQLVTSAFLETYVATFNVVEGDLYANGIIGDVWTQCLVCYYDINGDYIDFEYAGSSSVPTSAYYDKKLTIPDGTEIIRVQGKSDLQDAELYILIASEKIVYSIEDFQDKGVNPIDDIIELKDEVNDVNNALYNDKEIKLQPYFTEESKYINKNTGAVTSSINVNTYYNSYEVDDLNNLYASGIIGSVNTTSLAVYFDENETYLGFEYPQYDSIVHGVEKCLLNPPINTKIIKITGRTGLQNAELYQGKDDFKFVLKTDFNSEAKQMQNEPLPKKESLKILMFGSSWLMNTYFYLNKFLESAGVNAELKAFYTGGATFTTWLNAYNNNTAIQCRNSVNGANWTTANESFKTAIESDNYDIIITQQGARQAIKWADWINWNELVKIVKMNNPTTPIVFNSTFTPAIQSAVELAPYPATLEGKKLWQLDNYKNTQKFIDLSGVDIVIPNGANMWLMRANEDLNIGLYDMADDGLHPNNGLPMYGLTACLFERVIRPVTGKKLEDVTWLPDSSTQKAPVSGSSFDAITSAQADLIKKTVREALSDNWIVL